MYSEMFKIAMHRDEAKCVYCELDILRSFDAFASSHLDHLRPKSKDGPCYESWNRVIACGVCNSLKGSFDPTDRTTVTADNFKLFIGIAKKQIDKKRRGELANEHYTNLMFWRSELGRHNNQDNS
jgi:5-methylcytosine-specific restriction endonuclease McrA